MLRTDRLPKPGTSMAVCLLGAWNISGGRFLHDRIDCATWLYTGYNAAATGIRQENSTFAEPDIRRRSDIPSVSFDAEFQYHELGRANFKQCPRLIAYAQGTNHGRFVSHLKRRPGPSATLYYCSNHRSSPRRGKT